VIARSTHGLHAEVAVPAGDRARLERLCRYICRPPIAQDRLEEHPGGKLRYTFKKPWKVIERDWYQILAYRLNDRGECLKCGDTVAGVFDGPVGTPGRRRFRVATA